MSLIWNPVITAIKQHSQAGSLLTACISAFTTVQGVEQLLQVCNPKDVYFITRWRVPELALGVCDLEVYELLRREKIALYINYRLHSKIFRFGDGSLICGSCNATSPGLGLSESQNIETACYLPKATLADEVELKKLRDSCLRVDEAIYYEFQKAVAECPKAPPLISDDIAIYERHFKDELLLLSDLPATKHPSQLLDRLKKYSENNHLSECMAIDCITLGFKEHMSSEEAERQLSRGFRESPFVRLVVEEIRREGSMSFGAMTSFIHDHCRDVPAPYRSEVKETVNTLYNWLCFYFEDLSWDVPGARSQVIRSNRRS